MFAPSAQLPKLLNEYNKYLAHYTPCNVMEEEELIIAIAVTHVELILIHPFREGNGRLSRLLADVMAVQGGYKPLDYQSWEQNKTQYISAIHAGMSMDYAPMKYLGQSGTEKALPAKMREFLRAASSEASTLAEDWPVSTAVDVATERMISEREGLA